MTGTGAARSQAQFWDIGRRRKVLTSPAWNTVNPKTRSGLTEHRHDKDSQNDFGSTVDGVYPNESKTRQTRDVIGKPTGSNGVGRKRRLPCSHEYPDKDHRGIVAPYGRNNIHSVHRVQSTMERTMPMLLPRPREGNNTGTTAKIRLVHGLQGEQLTKRKRYRTDEGVEQ